MTIWRSYTMLPGKEWIEKYEKVKELLVSPVHYGNLFSQDEVHGKKLFILPMGTVNFPTEIFWCVIRLSTLTKTRSRICKKYLQEFFH